VNFLLATVVVVVFAIVIELLDLPDRAREVGDRALGSLKVLRDPGLDDRAKEKALRHHAIRLFSLVGILGGGSLLALGLPLFVVWLLELGGVASLDSVIAVLERVDFLVGAGVIGTVMYLLFHRLQQH
jgi:hypothetical protein